jgi:hypothetical protein
MLARGKTGSNAGIICKPKAAVSGRMSEAYRVPSMERRVCRKKQKCGKEESERWTVAGREVWIGSMGGWAFLSALFAWSGRCTTRDREGILTQTPLSPTLVPDTPSEPD